MVLKEDQEELRALLVGAIPMLCKERLNFSHNFRVDAVIGVTIDNKEHFYISLNDSIQLGSETLASAKMKQTSIAPSSPTLEMCVESKDGFGDFDDKDVVIKTELDISDEFAEIGENISESIGALNSQEGTSSSLDSPNKPKRGRKRRSKATGSTPAKKLTLLKDVKANSTTRTSTVTSEGDVSANEPESMRDVADGGQEDRVEDGDRGDAWSSDGHDDTKTDVQQHEQFSYPISERSETLTAMKPVLMSKDAEHLNNSKPNGQMREIFDIVSSAETDDQVISKKSTTKEYSCNECNKTFSTSSHLSRHHRVHTNSMFTCGLCDRKYYEKAQLATHVRNVHEIGKLQCDRCSKQFESEQGLKAHILWHDGDYKFQCEYCGHKYLNSAAYKTHINQHEGLTPYKCDICEKGFSSAGSRKRHAETCCNETRSHVCVVCGKGYKTQKYLKEHMQSHNEQSKFVCDICHKAYTFKCSLAEHRKKHH